MKRSNLCFGQWGIAARRWHSELSEMFEQACPDGVSEQRVSELSRS